MLLSKIYSFEAAHQLPDWPGVHGHSYEVEICLEGGGDYVMPLDEMDAAVAPALKKVDHTMLNDRMEMPTMENIARWFWEQLSHLPLHHVAIKRPTLDVVCTYDRK